MIRTLYVQLELLKQIGIGLGVLVIIYTAIHFTLHRLGKSPNFLIPKKFVGKIRTPLLLFLIALGLTVLKESSYFPEDYTHYLSTASTLLFILSVTWGIIVALKVIKLQIISNYDIEAKDNLKARKIYTQFNILERISIFIIVLIAIGIALMSFESIRSVGVSMLTSAGVAGIIIGFAAQKALGTLLAGIQIAFTQPIRIDDVVIVEGEWGVIEEILLTYVVIRIWDKRRLVVPTTYFIEKPFQNWTRKSSDLLGTVFIHTDYKMNIEDLRSELGKILRTTDLWDEQVEVLQVTDAKATSIEIRALMSAKDAPTAWDLRVYVREKLVEFIQTNYPESIPKTRVLLNNQSVGSGS